MKSLIFFFLLVSIAVAQNQLINPDGEGASLHLSPFLSSGSEVIDEETTVDYKSKVGIALLLKIPINRVLTVSPFYEYKTFLYNREIETGYYTIRSFDVVRKETKLGFTLSFYFR